MSDRFTMQLWEGSEDIYDAILAHPFLAGLADGSLAHDAFAFFVVQDALYLQKYANALAAVASRAPDTEATETFARDAADIITVEREMHGTLLADLGIAPESITAAEPAPTTLAYTSYLMATTLGGSYAEGVGTILPCYWIYWEVGKELVHRGSPDPRYQRWIDMYGSERVRLGRPEGDGHHRPPRRGAVRGAAHPGAPALPHHQPVRVDVLGHGLPPGSLAGVTGGRSRAGVPGRRRASRVSQRTSAPGRRRAGGRPPRAWPRRRGRRGTP